MMSSLVLALLVGCGHDGDKNIDDEVSVLISSYALTGDPSTNRTIPSINSPKAQLGMKLFYTKGLGGDKDSACVTCHHPVLGGGDNLSLSVGVGAVIEDLLGEGRLHDASSAHYDGFAPVPRNAPSTLNIALWDSVLFWDGRVQSITPNAGENGSVGGIRTPDSAFGFVDLSAGANLTVAQARFPVTSPEEMKGFVFEAGNSNDVLRTALATRFVSQTITNTWQNEFDSVYGTNSVNFPNIVDAIGEYERSQVFVNTPWKAYVQGDTSAISTEAKHGAKLFFSSYEAGGMNCVMCHSGDFFTDESFHVAAMPQVGRGKGDGVEDDFGRMRESSDSVDKYAFRTPTLLNVEMTGPWGHAGGYTSLRAVVTHMVNPDTAVPGYDLSQLDSMVKTTNTASNTALALAQLNANRTAGISPHQSVIATDGQIDNLVEFLKTLTDPCTKDRNCLSPWIPDNLSGPDSLQLNAVDQASSLL
ncbi:MAG: cytochrome-c peroxidase [Arcobacter sp.]|nr:MAG: cytochrome-c peroxidase [Arcobacter sp.]